jgi:hypothetical protein
MNNLFLTSTLIAISYFVFKLIDIKYIKKENLILKNQVRNTIIVYLSSLTGLYLIDNINNNVTENNMSVYTDKPDF